MKNLIYTIKKNPEEGIFYILVFLILILWFYIIYLFISWYFIKLKSSDLDKQINNIKSEIANLKKEDDIRKYYILKGIKNDLKRTSRYEAISQIYNVYLKIVWMSKWNFEIQKVDVDFEKLSLKLRVEDRRVIYKNGWIIDSFIELPFVKNIKIPSYIYENWINFDLNANIDLNAKSKP